MNVQILSKNLIALLIAATFIFGGAASSARAAGPDGPDPTAKTQTAPVNDDFANASVLGGNSGNVPGSTISGTKEPGEPSHARNRGGASIWYKYVAPADFLATISTQTSSFDTTLAIYTGTALNNLKLVAANDDTASGVTSSVTFSAKLNTTYYIAVDGYYSMNSGTFGSGSVNLSYSFAFAPSNDNFVNAITLIGTSGKFVTTGNFGATKEAGEPIISSNDGGSSVWYKWTAPAGNKTYTFTVDVVNLIGSPLINGLCAIYTGSAVNSLTQVTYNAGFDVDELTFTPVAGTTYYLALDGFNLGAGAQIGTFSISYSVNKDSKMADFDRDGRADIAVFRPSTGTWYSLDSITDKLRAVQFGTNGDQPFLGDFDRDGVPDYNVFRPSAGVIYTLGGFGFQFNYFGTNGDIPLSYHDALGSQFAVFRPSSGFWYFRYGSTFSWGVNGDIPVLANFNFTGFDQHTVFRPSNGTWYSEGTFPIAIQFGTNGDRPVPADYDGDGRKDVAVFRPSNGTWYIRNSSDGSITGVQWGAAGDIPQPADYDGDGRSDVAVFRSGAWYILQSSSATLRTAQFGLPGDIPVSSAYR
ncbi:MAG: VCBS repeat-containing protein [Pyrinomonadaceae bacterium]